MSLGRQKGDAGPIKLSHFWNGARGGHRKSLQISALDTREQGYQTRAPKMTEKLLNGTTKIVPMRPRTDPLEFVVEKYDQRYDLVALGE